MIKECYICTQHFHYPHDYNVHMWKHPGQGLVTIEQAIDSALAIRQWEKQEIELLFPDEPDTVPTMDNPIETF